MRSVAGLRPEPLGDYSAPPEILAVIRGRGKRESRERKGLGIGRGGRENVNG